MDFVLTAAWLPELNLALRAGLVALLLLLAWLLWRDHGRAVAARLGAAAPAGLAAYALLLALCRPGEAPAAALAPLVALSTGNAVVFWLLARALFSSDEHWRPHPRHALAWAAMALAGWLACRGLPPGWAEPVQAAITLVTLATALAALALALGTWRADLVEPRRRLRLLIVVAGTGYTLVNTGTKLLLGQPGLAPLVVVMDALALAACVLPLVAQLLRGGAGQLFGAGPGAAGMSLPADAVRPVAPMPVAMRAAVTVVEQSAPARTPPLTQPQPQPQDLSTTLAAIPSATNPAPPPPSAPAGDAASRLASGEPAAPAGEAVPDEAAVLTPTDHRNLAALARLMTEQRIYREEGLTIGALADRLGMPEHKLRRLINQGLGQRNFNQYLNAHRLADARAVLADPAQQAVPVLTVALEAGFQSLGPFNRAFKAATGMTPSEYRRQALAADPAASAR